MYIVTIDRPYYPVVVYIDELAEAKTEMKKLISEHKIWDGCACKVAISEVIEIQDIKKE